MTGAEVDAVTAVEAPVMDAPAVDAPGVDAPAVDTPARTRRSRAKVHRRTALLGAAAQLFAERGFDRVSIEDLGAAAGVSGPALYRHFPSKQAVLAALLIGVSERLLEGGTQVVAEADDPAGALDGLVRFHVAFALSEPDVIRVQGRDLPSLAEADQRTVRALQRQYVDVWVGVLQDVLPHARPAELRLRAHATFGLLNSTPHSARGRDRAVAAVLEQMALAALAPPHDVPAHDVPAHDVPPHDAAHHDVPPHDDGAG